jgi:hypothetical protein
MRQRGEGEQREDESREVRKTRASNYSSTHTDVMEEERGSESDSERENTERKASRER